MLKLSSIELGTIRLFALIEKTRITRYVFVWVGIWQSIMFIRWSFDFATTSTRTGSDIALIIGAIGVPLSALTGFSFAQYINSSGPPSSSFVSTQTTEVVKK